MTGVSYYPLIHFTYHNGMSCRTIKNVKDVPVCVMKAYRWVDVQLHSFYISTLYGDWSASCLHYFSPKVPQYPQKWKLGGAHRWFGHFREEKNLIHDNKLTKCTNLFLRYLYYNITINTPICFRPQGTIIRQSNQRNKHKTKLVSFVQTGVQE